MGTLWNDIRYGLRMLLKTPALSFVAIVTVALGVGLTTHTFSIVYGSLMRGLPYEGAERLMYLDRNNLSEGIENMSVSVHDFTDWREQQTLFEDLGASRGGTVNVVDAEGRPERFDGAFVSAGLFSQIGVQPLMGRGFNDEDDAGHTPQTIILGYDVWQTRYGGDPNILGRTIRANSRSTTIIGVMPPGFRFPIQEEVWMPLNLDPIDLPRGEGWSVQVFGRLREGVSLDAARTEMAGIAQRLATEYPQSNEGIDVSVKTFIEGFMPPEISAVLYVMLFAVFGVLLIACANVANLLLARSLVRSKEVAIRSALGASRGRVIRQLLVEATLLSLIGGVLGIALSKVGIDLFNAALVDVEKPYWIVMALHPPVLAFALGVTLLASIVSGTLPAIRASGGNLHDVLKD
ncbi:MAG: ABC transporter permease, partial [Gemmatimonadetes bacterium]|nr:ABC transporter permease [Gemmatimonadota bacterium]